MSDNKITEDSIDMSYGKFDNIVEITAYLEKGEKYEKFYNLLVTRTVDIMEEELSEGYKYTSGVTIGNVFSLKASIFIDTLAEYIGSKELKEKYDLFTSGESINATLATVLKRDFYYLISGYFENYRRFLYVNQSRIQLTPYLKSRKEIVLNKDIYVRLLLRGSDEKKYILDCVSMLGHNLENTKLSDAMVKRMFELGQSLKLHRIAYGSSLVNNMIAKNDYEVFAI